MPIHGAGRAGQQTREYKAWHCMKQRCTNPNYKKFAIYGGRGISVCPQWIKFPQFLADMGPCPPGLTLERKDSNGNYEPTNCRWASYREQNRNTTQNHWITFRGETLCLQDWAERIGIRFNTLIARLNRWPLERAMTEPRNTLPWNHATASRKKPNHSSQNSLFS